MQKTFTITRYLIAIVIVVALAGLAAWYFFLKTQSTTTVSQDVARGLGSAAPSFTGSAGSAYQNVVVTAVNSSSVDESGATGTTTPPELWHVTLTPVAGMGFVSDTAGMQLHFVERASGNVFSVNLQTGVLDRITNTLLPKIYVASFTGDGAVVERSIDANGKTTAFAGYSAPQKTPSTLTDASSSPNALTGTYLDQNIVSLAVNPLAREVFYILNDPKAGVIGIRSAWDGTKQKRVFGSGIAGWRTYWLSDGRIVLAQDPAYSIDGYAYALENNGSLTPLIRNVPGLMILPRASSPAIVYSTATDNTLALYAENSASNTALLPVKTVADKCVWAPGKQPIVYCAVPQSLGIGDFIDPWLQGRIHTSDVWWKIHTDDGTAEVLFTSENSSVGSIDVVHPTIDGGGHYLAFMNGVDASLWVLRIPGDEVATSTATH